MKISLFFSVLILLFSCGGQTESTKKQEGKNISATPDTIISKYYGNDTGEVQLFNDGEIRCAISQVIDGSSCQADIYLYFTPQSSNETQITNVTGQMKWQYGGKIIPSPFLLSNTSITIFNNGDHVAESSFMANETITKKFKKISGVHNELLYNLKFSDSTYKNIPTYVERVIIDLQIDLATNGKIKQYKKTVDLNAKINKIIIPFGLRND